jgi:hypothetical protein
MKYLKRFNEMVEIPKTWTKQEQTDTRFDIEEIFIEFVHDTSDIKVNIDSYNYLNKEGEFGEYVVIKFTPNKKFDFTSIESIKKGKSFDITQEFADRYNQFLKWAKSEGFTIASKVETAPYEITKKDGKIGKTNPQVKPEINKCNKMVGRECRTFWVIGYKKLNQDETH